jgi:hypothetical protein
MLHLDGTHGLVEFLRTKEIVSRRSVGENPNNRGRQTSAARRDDQVWRLACVDRRIIHAYKWDKISTSATENHGSYEWLGPAFLA